MGYAHFGLGLVRPCYRLFEQMATHMPAHSLSDVITTLWAPSGLALNGQGRPAGVGPVEPERKRRKVLAALKNRGYGFQRAADSLSEDEADFERQYTEIRGFGYSWMVPTGRTTSQEDEADAFLDPAEHDEASPGPRPTMTHPLLGAAARPRDGPEENETTQDLDASVEDRDASAENPEGSQVASESSSSQNEGMSNDAANDGDSTDSG